jgi:hypothetical protein
VIKQKEVLERVIKARYKALSENFAKMNAAFEKLAHESIKEKKRKKKITKYYNNLWWLAKRLKRKIKKLRRLTHIQIYRCWLRSLVNSQWERNLKNTEFMMKQQI